MIMVSVHIKSWDETKAWTTFTGYHPKDLERRLTILTGLQHTAVKKLVRQLKRRECITISLPKAADCFAASSLRSFLEPLGALVEVTKA
jgi:hypothetical protein